jgi:hypothetical protein
MWVFLLSGSEYVLVFYRFSISVGFFFRWRFKYQEVGIPLNGLSQPHFCACPKTGLEFPTSYVVVCLYLVIWVSVVLVGDQSK